MILERSMSDRWLSNTYLVAAEPGRRRVLRRRRRPGRAADRARPTSTASTSPTSCSPTTTTTTSPSSTRSSSAGPTREVLDPPRRARRRRRRDRRPAARPGARDRRPDACGRCTRPATPPGCSRCSSTAPTSSPATRCSRAPSAACARPARTSYADLKRSIMDVLLALPPETTIRPGHTDPTTVGDELESNGFVRIWRGEDAEDGRACTALGEQAHARAARRRLRRRPQGLGPLARRRATTSSPARRSR